MVMFELQQLFFRRKWRWLLICAVIAVMYLLMIGGSDYARNLGTGLVMVFSQQFISMVVMPSLFICQIVDLIVEDIETGLIGYTLPRSASRILWLLTKVISVFAAAFVFTGICLLVYLASSFMMGLPLGKNWPSLLFNIPIAPITVVTATLTNYILTLTAFGMFILMISILTQNSILSWVIGTIISIMGYVSWMYLAIRPFHHWFPTAQMMLLSQIPNKVTENLFTVQWSVFYNIVLFIISFFISLSGIRKMNLSRKA